MGAHKIENLDQAFEIIAETKRRYSIAPAFIDQNFPAQKAFIESPSRRKSALCTRRAGKSVGIARYLLKEAWNAPVGDCLYFGLTKETVRRIFWEPILKPLNKKLLCGFKANETTMSMTIERGNEASHIYCLGGDADEEEMAKALGGKYKLVVIDEAQSFRVNLDKFVNEMLEPALIDLGGTVCLTGTPDELTQGLFYEVTKQQGNRLPDWEVHEWTGYDNPYIAAKWKTELEDKIRRSPRVVETPAFKRMYLKQWVTDTESLCYKFSKERNLVTKLPDHDWTYVLGVDLGWNDASSFTLYAFSNTSDDLYVVESYKSPGMYIKDVAERIRYYMNKYQVSYIPCDPASKQVVEELKERYQIPLISAEKTGKAEFIEIMNSELIQGKIKLLDMGTKPLQDEYASLIWDKDAAQKVEHPSCQNDCADSALYGWRYCYQYLYQARIKKILSVEEKIERWEQEQCELISENKPFWEREDYV
jgi:hypothetical protein